MSFKQSIAALIVLFSVSFSAYADKIVYVHTKAYLILTRVLANRTRF